MKKFISLTLVILTVISLFVACQPNNNNNNQTKTEEKIAIVYESSIDYANTLEVKLKEKNIESTVYKSTDAIPDDATIIYVDKFYKNSLSYNQASINVLGDEIYLTANAYLGFSSLVDTVLANVSSSNDIVNLETTIYTFDVENGQCLDAKEDTATTIEIKSSALKNNVFNAPAFDVSKVSGKIIYVSNKGDDKNDGLTKATAIATISKLNTISLSVGDAVLFERGGLFRGTVSTKAGVTYSNYGEGQLPVLIQSSQNYAGKGLWVIEDASKNIWKLSVKVNDPGIIVFDAKYMELDDQDETVGKRIVDIKYADGSKYASNNSVTGYSRLESAENLSFYWGTKATTPTSFNENLRNSYTLYLKSEKDPNTFDSIEIGEDYRMFSVGGSIKDVTIDGLCMKYIGGHTVSGSGILTEGLTVKNCVFCWSGGSMIDSQPGTRYGNAIEIFGGCDGFYVENNYIYQIYDTAITFQYHYSHSQKPKMVNIEFSYNLIENCYWATEWWISRDTESAGKNPEVGNVEVHDNIMRYSNNSYGTLEHGSQQQSPTTGASIVTGFGTDNVHDFKIYNNILECSYCEEKPTLNTRILTISSGDGNANVEYYGNTFLQKSGKLLTRFTSSSGSPVEKKFDNTGIKSTISLAKKDGLDLSDNAYIVYK